MFSLLSLLPVVIGFGGIATAAYFPPTPEGISVLQSKFHENVTISYKQTFICETTPGVNSYSGYIHLPANTSESQQFDINMFFWFFEARKDPANAPLSLWLQGGPGVPSITAALGENGPCIVTSDSKNTTLNPWSWNNEVNMLYIDQPVDVGFSYRSLVNGTINQLVSPVNVVVEDFSASRVPAVNSTFLVGTFASQNIATTLNTTESAAVAMWHFLQTWSQEFPAYRPVDNKISIWTESYGGHYGPIFANFFESQNDKIESGDIFPTATILHLDTLGIINGCIDIESQMLSYPEMAFNNTYGIELISQDEYQSAINSFPDCQRMISACRSAAASGDVGSLGNNVTVNNACSDASDYCFNNLWSSYSTSGRNVFDIGHLLPDPFTPKYAAGYLNQPEVQLALGVPLNFTGQSTAVSFSFNETGDFALGGNMAAIGSLLDRGSKVALIYGDRDYQCNWFGGEAVSLAVNSTFAAGFQTAGYANITTNTSYTGGMVRQNGNFSFSRVFESGHEVPWYQPETSYRIFQRAMFNTDIATGTTPIVDEQYSTKGPDSTFQVKNILPAQPEPQCYLWDVLETCIPAQMKILATGMGIVKDFILIGYLTPNGTEIYYGNTTTGDLPAPCNTSSPSQLPSSLVPASAAASSFIYISGYEWCSLVFALMLLF